MSDPSRRNDHFISGRFQNDDKSSDISGFPGAAGTVTGKVTVNGAAGTVKIEL